MAVPEKVNVSLYSKSDVVLDLWKGFLGEPGIVVGNDEDEDFIYCLPFNAVPRCKCCSSEGEERLDFGRALKLGALEIIDLSAARGHKIKLNYDQQLDIPPASERIFYASSHEQDHVKFGCVGSKLLEQLRCRMNPGSQYILRFTGQNLETRCEFGESSLIGAHKIEPRWDMHGLKFRVLAGTPVPRFAMSVSAIASSCSDRLAAHVHVELAVASLEERPVTINLMLDEYCARWPLEEDLYPSTLASMLSLIHKTRGYSGGPDGLAEVNIRIQEGFLHPSCAPELVEFKYGTTLTFSFCFRHSQLDLKSIRPDILKAEIAGFPAWDYGTKAKLSRDQRRPRDWCRHGPIIFETCSTLAPIIKAAFERERPMPLFLLPLELRDEVYSNLKYTDYRGVIRVPEMKQLEREWQETTATYQMEGGYPIVRPLAS